MVTVCSVRPPSRFGEMVLDNDFVKVLDEKSQMGTGCINGGFFVFDRRLFDYLTEDENCDFEFGALQKVVRDNQLRAYMHKSFWQCMDNVRERDFLDKLVKTNQAPWIKWK